MRKLILALTAASALTGTASTAEWSYIGYGGEAPKRLIIFADATSLKPLPNGHKTGWFEYQFEDKNPLASAK